MHSVSHKDFACIANMLASVKKVQEYIAPFQDADSFYENSRAFDACMMNFVVIGEMVEKPSDGFISNTEKNIDWYRIKGFRNIIAHNYFGIDAEEVW
jgi:uncharacterized protein with HEPN domain